MFFQLRNLFLGLLLSLPHFAFSQAPEVFLFKVDSCKSVNDTLGIARAFFGLVKFYDKVGNDIELGKTLDSTLKYANLSNNLKAIVSAKTFYASYVSDKGDHERSIALYREIHNGYLQLGDTARAADMLVNIGMEYNNLGRYSDALSEELKALKIREQIGNLSNIAKYYQLIGEVYKQLGQKDKWREYFSKADSLANANDLYANFFTQIGILNDMGGLYEFDGELEKAKATYEKMYTLCEKEQYANGLTVSLGNLVPVLKKMGLHKDALEKSLLALSISERTNRVYHIISDLNNIGELYLYLQQPAMALPYFKRAEGLTAINCYPLEQTQTWKGLYKTYKQLGDYRNALRYHELEVAASDSIKGLEVKKSVAELETRYETEKKEQQIRELSLRSEMNRKAMNALAVIISIALGLIALLIFLMRLRRKALAQQKELISKQREISHLNQEKLRTELDQKKRELSSLALQMASKSEFINDIKEKVEAIASDSSFKSIARDIDRRIDDSSEWEKFRLLFEEVHPSFFKLLKQRFPDLTSGETKLCALLKLNLSSKEIASINSVTIAAVDKSRNRLRKKLNLLPEESIIDFLDNL